MIAISENLCTKEIIDALAFARTRWENVIICILLIFTTD